ncbi:MAG: NTP transferase domain-containing protein [Bacteriovoracaceae bacterium]|nr:NTP transferase domain-containing protein [Bacteriovoracaceae bacterium]
MQIDHCLILAAGLGTRMGDIGKVLPKILWPVFEKTLLELQIDFAKSLGISNIFINTHHLSDSIQEFINKRNLSVTPIYEKELLDIGGAIYNLAASEDVQYKGNLLILNGDQFLCFDENFYSRGLDELSISDVVLFGITVPSGKGYRETILEGSTLTEIAPPSVSGHSYNTYSGVGLVALDKLTPRVGAQAFFNSVADFKSRKINMLLPESYEYWDFGTVERYWESSFKLLSQKNSKFYHFMVRSNSIVSEKNHGNGYNATNGIINLSEVVMDEMSDVQAIIFDGPVRIEKKGIYYQKTVDFI